MAPNSAGPAADLQSVSPPPPHFSRSPPAPLCFFGACFPRSSLASKKVAMPDRNPSSNQQGLTPVGRSLLERVRARVRTVNHVLQRRDTRTAPPLSPPHVAIDGPADRTAPVPLTRELRALRVVYHTLGRTHRHYRERTGEPVSPDLKAAARAFKREPSILSLVPVAGFLDDLRLLKW